MEAFSLDCSFDDLDNNRHQDTGGYRRVEKKPIPSRKEDGAIIPDAFDYFTGMIDAVTGAPVYGICHFTQTGETYEGSFYVRRENHSPIRHGSDASVSNMKLPTPQKAVIEEDNIFEITSNDMKNANFWGTYVNDEPTEGTLTTETLYYQGPWKRKKFHGQNGDLVIKPRQYRYLGEFQEGLFHGWGRETSASNSDNGTKNCVYKGEYRLGLKHGMGIYQEKLFLKNDLDKSQSKMNKKEWMEFWETATKHNEIIRRQDIRETMSDFSKQTIMNVQYDDFYLYAGYFLANQRHGEGMEYKRNKMLEEAFQGQFVANQRNGYGCIHNQTKHVTAEGEWKDGKAVTGNAWRIFYPNGDMYLGNVVLEEEDSTKKSTIYEPHNYGVYKNSSGKILYLGAWHYGQRHGNGITFCDGKAEFTGPWREEEEEEEHTRLCFPKNSALCEIAKVLMQKNYSMMEEQEIHNKKQDETETTIESTLIFLKKTVASSIQSSLHMIETAQESSEGNNIDELMRKEKERKSNKVAGENNSNESNRLKEKTTVGPYVYSNGDAYFGVLDANQRTGYGVYVSKASGCSYTGMFQKNQRHGFGVLIHSELGQYAGGFRKDKKHGHGALIFKDGCASYYGTFANGYFEGLGILCDDTSARKTTSKDCNNTTIYIGEWLAGLRHGEGMEMNDGCVYKGTFVNGKRDGKGTLFMDKKKSKSSASSSGPTIIYSGEWYDDKYHGEGVWMDHQLDASENSTRKPKGIIRWEGNFTAGKKHGYGVLTDETENMEWKGTWHDDNPMNGKWRISYADGGIYSGEAEIVDSTEAFEERSSSIKMPLNASTIPAIPEGFGTFQYPNGDIYVGNFEQGVRSGIGSCHFASGEHWEGTWSNDALDNKFGYGVLTKADGQVVEFNGVSSIGKFFSCKDCSSEADIIALK